MTLSELLTPQCVRIPLLARDKEGALAEVAEQIARVHALAHREDEILASFLARERIMSTGIGRGIAIPHAELAPPVAPAAVVAISPAGIEFGAPDGKPVFVLFALVLGRDLVRERIALLSTLSRIFRRQSVRDEIREARSADAVVAAFAREEEALRQPGHAGAATF